MEKNVVLYHKNCTDGFGGAYAAWKKFGNTATYIPARSNTEVPEGLEGKIVYCIDFCYPKEVIEALREQTEKLIVIDHHEMNREAAQAADEMHFDPEHSGAVLAWQYFHSETETPTFLTYIEDGDLYRHEIPESRAALAIIHLAQHEFSAYETLHLAFEDPTQHQEMIVRGTHYNEYFQKLVEQIAQKAELVEFEGYTVYATNLSGIFRSDVGHLLAQKQPPFAICWSDDLDKVKISLRGIGEVHLGKLAEKYGGGGHHDAASFIVKPNQNLPFTPKNV